MNVKMTVIRLSTIRVAKPWGRHTLWPGFADPAPREEPIGEIWFDAPEGSDPALMVKYLFTSERLSIQVHPNDAQAQAQGHKRGKEEAWLILAAEPDSTIALGTKRPLTAEELRAAALDGSIEDLMHWQSVKAGDVFYSPAGTVHAIGAGITLIEVQQNVDLTYRLYDYGRPRELHLDDGVAVSKPVPFVNPAAPQSLSPTMTRIIESDKFTIDRLLVRDRAAFPNASGKPVWFIPVNGHGTINGQNFGAGECWIADEPCAIASDHPLDLLVAYETHA
jgi:mannose-6-phosphate isomerase